MQETMAAVTDAYGTIRIMGSSALALYSVALGHAAGAIIGSFHLVDDLAGVLLAQEAGAVVLERAGGVMVAAPGVAEELALLWKTGTSS
jgi:fructose-1,6-bisphosphatase/inositol monophosphatase family enzyme